MQVSGPSVQQQRAGAGWISRWEWAVGGSTQLDAVDARPFPQWPRPWHQRPHQRQAVHEGEQRAGRCRGQYQGLGSCHIRIEFFPLDCSAFDAVPAVRAGKIRDHHRATYQHRPPNPRARVAHQPRTHLRDRVHPVQDRVRASDLDEAGATGGRDAGRQDERWALHNDFGLAGAPTRPS
jgi:hypothetical protein